MNGHCGGISPQAGKPDTDLPAGRMMDLQLTRAIAAAYLAKPNHLAASLIGDQVIKEQDALVNILFFGLPPDRIKTKVEQLAIRGLIEKIVPMPVPMTGKRSRLEMTVNGDLAGILSLTLNVDLSP